MSALSNFTGAFNISYKTYPRINLGPNPQPWNDTVGEYLNMTGEIFDDDVFDNRLKDSYFPYRYGSYFVMEANNRTK
jgi:hypothetical protein